MTKLETAKRVIKQHIRSAEHGIFDVRNFVNDPMANVYLKDGLQIDICYHHGYFEVFGMTCDEFLELVRYYKLLLRGEEWE